MQNFTTIGQLRNTLWAKEISPFLNPACLCHVPHALKQPILFSIWNWVSSWWRHQMETFSALLALCVTGEFPSVTRIIDVSLICALNKRLNKQSWGWWFEAPSRSLWRHCIGDFTYKLQYTPRYIDNRSRLFFVCGAVVLIWLSWLLHRHCYLHDDVIKWEHFPRYWPLCGEFTGPRWIPRTKASDAELCYFLWSLPE